MKAVVLILVASALALVAIVASALPEAPERAAKANGAGARTAWRGIAGSGAILPPRFVAAGDLALASERPAAPAMETADAVTASLPGKRDVPVAPANPSEPSPAITRAAADKPVKVARAGPDAATVVAAAAEPPTATARPGAVGWTLPLVDRTLSAAERAAVLAPELQDAINRMEPILDPTLLDDPVDVVAFRISAGTAVPENVFAERWRLASDDANVDALAASIGLAWRGGRETACDALLKRRRRDGGAASADVLSPGECDVVRRRTARRGQDAAPLPIMGAPVGLPAFAAPLPGSRMSSDDFWVAQRLRIEAAEARLRAQREARAQPDRAAKP